MDCFPAGGNRSLSHAPPDTFSCVLFQAVHIPISALKWWHRGHPPLKSSEFPLCSVYVSWWGNPPYNFSAVRHHPCIFHSPTYSLRLWTATSYRHPNFSHLTVQKSSWCNRLFFRPWIPDTAEPQSTPVSYWLPASPFHPYRSQENALYLNFGDSSSQKPIKYQSLKESEKLFLSK